MSEVHSVPLTDPIIVAIAQLVDDAQSVRRDPSHADLDHAFQRAGLTDGDPKGQGQNVGKAKRVRSTLSWAMEHNPRGGGEFVCSFIGTLRGYGAFRETSANYVGRHEIENAIAVFASEGYEFSTGGELRPQVPDALSGAELTEALRGYIRRVQQGSNDAALITGTGKDLLEAVAAHILQQRYGSYLATSNFPTLLGQLFVALGLATPMDPPAKGEPANKRVERAMYELACALNQLRNQQGTGHGRPWPPSVTDSEARMAIEAMGVIAERLLTVHMDMK